MNTIPSLATIYKDYFLIGAAVNSKTVISQNALLKTHFNSMTCENAMKFERLHPIENQFDFTEADNLVQFAHDHLMKIRGHTLVWHNQTPNWVFQENNHLVSKDTLFKRMNHHITQVLSRYKGQIYAWDVVNEAISDSNDEYLRPSKWLDIGGQEFIEKAFLYAHEADKNAQLFYNDYNTTQPIKRDKIYSLVKSLIDKGIPIHGIGMQGHWNVVEPSIHEIREAIEKFASLGVKIHITELDLSVFSWNDRRTELTEPEIGMVEMQNERYEAIFKLFRNYKHVIESVTFWGAADDYTWLNNFPVKGRKNWPFVFDKFHQPKESFWNITKFKGE